MQIGPMYFDVYFTEAELNILKEFQVHKMK